MFTCFLLSWVLLVTPAEQEKKQDTAVPTVGGYTGTQLLYQDDFEEGMERWQIEQQPGGKVTAREGFLEIDDARGCTAWFKQKLQSPVLVEFEVTMVKDSGPNDRVSDLNCFMMATDPTNDDVLANGHARAGKFSKYNSLKLYYVGYGANGNATTRFRKYVGDGSRPVLPEHDLKGSNEPNKKRKVQVLVADGVYQYWIDGERVFRFEDDSPYTEGWFAFRTVNNRMRIDDFQVWQIEATKQ